MALANRRLIQMQIRYHTRPPNADERRLTDRLERIERKLDTLLEAVRVLQQLKDT